VPEELASPPALASVPPLLPPDPPFELLPASPPLLLFEPLVEASSNAGLPPELVAAPLLEPPLVDVTPELLAPVSEPIETPAPENGGGPLSLLQAATRRAAQQIAQTKARGFILRPRGAVQPRTRFHSGRIRCEYRLLIMGSGPSRSQVVRTISPSYSPPLRANVSALIRQRSKLPPKRSRRN